jgi:hypothetical protein
MTAGTARWQPHDFFQIHIFVDSVAYLFTTRLIYAEKCRIAEVVFWMEAD